MFLCDLTVLKASIIAIQELWRNELIPPSGHIPLYPQITRSFTFNIFAASNPTISTSIIYIISLRYSLIIKHLVLRDINIHYPTWGGSGTKINNKGAKLLEIIDYYKLKLAIEEGINIVIPNLINTFKSLIKLLTTIFITIIYYAIKKTIL
ncbi:hypothetical protein DPV78_010214 [Talaromyces pinophilus]|nr:hypothetical protein DPV78_010214 [Talaromyces pinophilus]